MLELLHDLSSISRILNGPNGVLLAVSDFFLLAEGVEGQVLRKAQNFPLLVDPVGEGGLVRPNEEPRVGTYDLIDDGHPAILEPGHLVPAIRGVPDHFEPFQVVFQIVEFGLGAVRRYEDLPKSELEEFALDLHGSGV